MTQEQTQPQQLPMPDPALRRLDPFIGSWTFRGRTVGATADDFIARTTFAWLPGGFFLRQEFTAEYRGMRIEALELIWYDPSSGTFPSTVYSNIAGFPIPYRYDIRGRDVTITTDLAGGATMNGRISEDSDTFSGGWRPNPGAEGQGNDAYDFVATRVR